MQLKSFYFATRVILKTPLQLKVKCNIIINVNGVIKGKLATAKMFYASFFCWTKFLIVVKIVVNSPFFYFSKKKLLQ